MSVRNAGTAGPPTSTRISTVMGVPGPAGPPGSAGAAGAAGTNGNPGVNAFTRTSASFTMPAPGASIVASIANPITWIGVNQRLAIETAGVLIATAIGGTTVTLLNPNPAPAGNASTGTTIPSNSLVSPGGIGAAGPAGPAPPGIGPLVNQTSGVPLALSATEGQGAVVVGGIPQAMGLRRVFNVLSYGAVGDGVHDDTTGIQAAENARAAFSAGPDGIAGAVLYFPPGTYLTSGELVIQGRAAVWEGDGKRHPVIKVAGSAGIRSAIAVTQQECIFRDFSIDCNRGSKYGFLRAGDGQSIYENLLVENAKLDGFSSITILLPGRSVSGITQTGPGPAITATVSNEVAYPPITTARVLITTTGANDGSGRYKTSHNGGVTYSVIQEIHPVSHPTDALGNAALDLGLEIAFGAGTYQAGTFYDIAINQIGGDTNNDSACFRTCRADTCGVLYATAGAYHSAGPPLTVVSGTVATTTSSNVVVGTGTSFLSTGARPGDFIYITANNQWYQILCVMDDTHIAIGFNSIQGNLINTSGQDFIISVGAGFYDAVNGDSNIQTLVSCVFGTNCPQGIVLQGVIGNTLITPDMSGVASVGLCIGTDDGAAVINTVVIRPYFEPINNVVAIALFNTSIGGVTILEPSNYDRHGGGTELVTTVGQVYGLGRLDHTAFQWNESTTTVTTDGQIIAPPTMGVGGTGTSLINLTSSANHTIDMSAPAGSGIVVRLRNAGSFNFFLSSVPVSGGTLSLMAPKVVLGPDATIELVSDGAGHWRQTGPVEGMFNPLATTMFGPGENIINTTDATATEIYRIYAAVGDTLVMGFEADITGFNTNTGDAATYRGCACSFKQGTQLGALTIDESRGTDAGFVPPAGWGGVTLSAVSGVFGLFVQGAAASPITWRCRIRFF